MLGKDFDCIADVYLLDPSIVPALTSMAGGT